MGVRYVIAGESQCDLFAEICLIADYLSQSLPSFCYERIEKPVAEWKLWIQKINVKNKWHHIGSPIVWKELLTAGSKAFYIGGASEFLEYCYSYYNLDIFPTPKRFEDLVDSIGQYQKKITQEARTVARSDNSDLIGKAAKNSFAICISGAGNPLVTFIISDLLECYGDKNISKIFIYDDKCSRNLMDFIENECNYVGHDFAGKIVKHVEKLGVALICSDLLIILDYVPFQSTYSIGEWLHKNRKLMESIAIKINTTASPKLLVVLPNLGPACYNATVLAKSITKINKNNIVVTTSDIGLEMAPVASEIADVPLRNMFCPPVWGFVGINHLTDICTTIHKYDSFYPNERYTKVRNSTLSIGTLTPEMRTMEYLMFFGDSLWKNVSNRMLRMKNADKHIYINKAVALVDLIKIWLFDPKPNYTVNLGIHCNGSFGLTFNGIFSQPAQLINGQWQPASNYVMPKDPQMSLSYLQKMAEITMNLRIYELPQVVSYTPCVCKRKKPEKNKKVFLT